MGTMSDANAASTSDATIPVPAGAVGFPSRAADLDVLPGFRTPPAGYGEVAFFWWLGDPLTRDRLTWQLDRLANKSISGLQINYAHSDKGGLTFGATYPSTPALFSEPWWELVGWFMQEARKRGMAVSLSDYTLGIGQGWVIDDAIKAYPQLNGSVLTHQMREVAAGQEVTWQLEDPLLAISAIQTGELPVDLMPFTKGQQLTWHAPHAGTWQLIAVCQRNVIPSIDPMHPGSGKAIVEKFFQPFEDRNPGESGRGLNFFFSDELTFGVSGRLWNSVFADEFRRRKGYDIRPVLPALFVDIGPGTPRIRMDYNDVLVELSEQHYFRPVYEWHQKRGMLYGCDHGGRGRDVAEFGDYFRTQRWNQGPGCDQPHLERDVVKNKVASSIAHLYERPRTWLEGFYGSGWGTSSAQVADATFANFLQGQNLLTLHGLYYSTHGGWWEWAPPCNHWRMPYWEHMGEFLKCSERLSYLLSQGTHVADVAVLYPVAAVEAGMDGALACNTAFAVCEKLYNAGTDLDFIDFQSLDRAQIRDGRLHVASEAYRVLILPAMKAIRHSALAKAHAFAKAGGIVVAIGALPEASDRTGRNDPEVARLVCETFGIAPGEKFTPHTTTHAGGGLAITSANPDDAVVAINSSNTADFRLASGVPSQFIHRRIGPRDIYALYGVPADTLCTFRATGRVELWDPWTGTSREIPAVSQDAQFTRVSLPLDVSEVQIIVFSPGQPRLAASASANTTQTSPVTGPWDCECRPTLDNRWGDFRWPPSPAMIGPEARRFRYQQESGDTADWHKPSFDDLAWDKVGCGYGVHFLKLGPLPAGTDVAALDARYAKAAQLQQGTVHAISDVPYRWEPYAFSWRTGVEDDHGHQGYHGLKQQQYDEFIRLGELYFDWDGAPSTTRRADRAGNYYYLWSTVHAPCDMQGTILTNGLKPSAAYLNGRPIPPDQTTVSLTAGANWLLLRYDSHGTGYFLIVDSASSLATEATTPSPVHSTTGPLAMRWFGQEGILAFDIHPVDQSPAGLYRFQSPPGMRSLVVRASGPVTCWINGEQAAAVAGSSAFAPAHPIRGEATIALRIEQPRGQYAGAVLCEPVEFDCVEGTILPGDWSRIPGLTTYSGGMWYRKTVSLQLDNSGRRVLLDLGKVVSSAEVHINGQPAGIRVAPPYRFDITGFARSGDNRIEVLVYNTLGNHYTTIPTRYPGAIESGLIGPVNIIMQSPGPLDSPMP